MKYLLVRPKLKSVFSYLEPLGLEYVSGVLASIGKKYEIYDEFDYPLIFRKRRLRKKIRNYSPDVVCFTAYANTVDDIILSAKMIKALKPSVIIIVGGPQAELNFSEFFVDCIDYIFQDRGLESFREAEDRYMNFNEIKMKSILISLFMKGIETE